ncbi:hypothetical protein CAL26_02800 [Bordetella genomosp. 9]|uniref:Secreted protein n=1 Tax=Bordetella genomosp. 9 TaxID=1416803 RepID=A0A261RN01_9BORD|nr:hypothetical protein [Bordetella genomosp. 9]OZI26281.1 hypothetical protein CAL26_02800 [Bordetella genomosp. 9]
MPTSSISPITRAGRLSACALGLAALLAAGITGAAETQPDASPAPPVGAAPPMNAAAPADPAPPTNPVPPVGVMQALPPVPPPPPRIGAGPPPIPPADEGALVTTQATVSRFIPNPDGDVEGFLSTDGVLVRFPPHLSTELTSTVRPGDGVQISGRKDAAGNLKAERIVDTSNGRALVDRPPAPGTPPVPPGSRSARLSQLSAQGRVAYVMTTPRGDPDGAILADGTVIKLAPPDARQFTELLRAGADVSAQGYGMRNQYGTALQATSFGMPGNEVRLYDRAPPAP